MRNSKVLAAALISSSLAGAAPALAQEGKGFGQDGQIILSAERLFGLSFNSTKTEDGDGGGSSTRSDTTISLLWPAGGAPYQVPRAAFDVIVASGFTVGGSIGFISTSGTIKREITNGPSNEQDSPSVTVFALAPRIGYALAITDQFAFWPRAGITYFSVKSESKIDGPPAFTSTTSINGLGLDVEPMFVFSPVSHFGIVAGPVLDFPLSGSASNEISPAQPGVPASPDDKYKSTNYGITVGVLGYF